MIEVAIKEASSPSLKGEMLDEAKAMIKVSKHDHIVNIQGIRPFYLCKEENVPERLFES